MLSDLFGAAGQSFGGVSVLSDLWCLYVVCDCLYDKYALVCLCACVLGCVCSCSQLPAHSSIIISAVFWAQGGTKCHSLPVNYVAILPPPYAWGLSPIRRHRNHRSMHGNTMEDQIKTRVIQLKWADVPVLIKALADKFTAGVNRWTTRVSNSGRRRGLISTTHQFLGMMGGGEPGELVKDCYSGPKHRATLENIHGKYQGFEDMLTDLGVLYNQ